MPKALRVGFFPEKKLAGRVQKCCWPSASRNYRKIILMTGFG
jgi:hypothetical protein